ncbi:MAG: AMP-binding protein [Alphaproteobacteria bacterium]|nr:AMP-binding protein [Alphaproteobacteria bacterium]
MTALSDDLFHALHSQGDRPALDGQGVVLSHRALAAAAETRAMALRADGVGEGAAVPVSVDNRPADVVELLAVWRLGAVVVPIHRATPDAVRLALVDRLTRALVPEGASTIVFTSGSTGEPKGVVLLAERQAAKLRAIRGETRWCDGARTLLALQLTFSFGQWVTALTLLSGGTLVFPDRLAVAPVMQRLLAGDIDRAPAVPTLLRGLLDHPEAAALGDWPGAVMAGGEVLPAALGARIRKAWPKVALSDIYGLSETGTCDFYVDPDVYDAAAGSLGRAGAGIDWTVLDSGELCIRSPWRMAEYLDAPEATAAAFDDEGYFHTGDLVAVRSDGRPALIGRAKELINRGGLKIAPLEVEAALAAHPDVAGALVGGVPDQETGEAVVAVVVPAPGRTVDPERLRAWLGERIERYKIPSRLAVVDALPVGRTGKADRGAVAALLEALRI